MKNKIKYRLNPQLIMNNYLKSKNKLKKKKEIKGVNTGKERQITRLILKTYVQTQKEMNDEYKIIHEKNKEFLESYKLFEEITKKKYHIEDSFKDLIIKYKELHYKIPDFSTRHNLFTSSPLLLHNKKIEDFYKYNPIRENIDLSDPNVKLTQSEKGKKYLDKVEKFLLEKNIFRRNDEEYEYDNFKKKLNKLSKNNLTKQNIYINLNEIKNTKSRKEYLKEINDLKDEINNTEKQIKEMENENEKKENQTNGNKYLKTFRIKKRNNKSVINNRNIKLNFHNEPSYNLYDKNTSNEFKTISNLTNEINQNSILNSIDDFNNKKNENRKSINNIKKSMNNNMNMTQTTFHTSLGYFFNTKNNFKKHSRNTNNNIYFQKRNHATKIIHNYNNDNLTIESYEHIKSKTEYLENVMNIDIGKLNSPFYLNIVSKYCDKFEENNNTFDKVLKGKCNPITLLDNINNVQTIIKEKDLNSIIITSDRKMKKELRKIKSLDNKILKMDKKMAIQIININD